MYRIYFTLNTVEERLKHYSLLIAKLKKFSEGFSEIHKVAGITGKTCCIEDAQLSRLLVFFSH